MSASVAQRMTELDPSAGAIRNTLGVARFYAGDARGAVTALEESIRLSSDGEGDEFDWLFLAMAHLEPGEEEAAVLRYERSLRWLEQDPSQDPKMVRFRAEPEERFREC